MFFCQTFIIFSVNVISYLTVQLHFYSDIFKRELEAKCTTRLWIYYDDMMGLRQVDLGFGSNILSSLTLPSDVQQPCTCYGFTKLCLFLLHNDSNLENFFLSKWNLVQHIFTINKTRLWRFLYFLILLFYVWAFSHYFF